jgi:hypothetical protein
MAFSFSWIVFHQNPELIFSGVSRGGTQRFGNHYYWLSWTSNEPRLTNNKWDWFNARYRKISFFYCYHLFLVLLDILIYLILGLSNFYIT